MTRVIIIGAGIVGMSIARELSQYELDIVVIEKNSDVGWGISKANTALIHGGYDDDPERYPVRARLCVRGNEIWHRWVEELQIPHVWNGALVIASSEEERRELGVLLRRGEINGVEGMKIIEDEIFTMERNLNENALAALWIPSVGQIAPIPAVIALAENSVDNGVKIMLDTEVKGIGIENGCVSGVETNKGFVEGDIIINAAGLYADEISRMAGVDYFTIHPRKGEYWLFDDSAGPKPEHVLFPAPTKKSKGVVVTTEISGHLMIGPNAHDLSPDEKEDLSNTREGLEEVWEKARKIWPKLPPRSKVIRTFAGLRPETEGADFIIRSEEVRGFINVAGIRSPGLTAAPAIAREVSEILEGDLDISLVRKKKWNPHRREITHFFMMNDEGISLKIRENAAYGRIICKCNKVSEGDILEAIERMKKIGVQVPSVDSVKFRTKATTGTCQGGFCRPKIVEILSREYNVPMWDVTLKGKGTEIAVGDVKVLRRGARA